jgi:hypothetical protein
MTKTTNVARLIELLPDLALDTLRKLGGRKLAEQRQAALITMIVATYSGSNRAHNRIPGAASFSWDELRRRLHTQHSDRCHVLLSPFFEYPAQRRRFYKGSTKPYTLKPHVLAACQTWAAESGPAIITAITREHVLDAAEAAREQGNLKATAGLMLVADESEDGLSNVVVGQQSNGRLIPDASSAHLVTMPKDQRKLLLQQGDEDLYDYDFESCHPRIVVDLCRHYGLPHARLQGYIDHKTDAGTTWAKIIGHETPRDFKTIILSLLSGGTLSTSPHSTCGKLLGPERAKQFAAIPLVSALAGEIRSSMQQIVQRLTHKANAVGRTLPEGATVEQQCSHILTGFEQFALRVVCASLPEGGLITTIYDGWASRVKLSDQQLRDLEEQVTVASNQELNVAIHVRIVAESFRDAAFYGFVKESEPDDF